MKLAMAVLMVIGMAGCKRRSPGIGEGGCQHGGKGE